MKMIPKQLEDTVRCRVGSALTEFYFEPNDKVTRDSINLALNIVLEGMGELDDFAIIVDETNNTEERINNNELWVDLAIKPFGDSSFYFVPFRIKPDNFAKPE